MTATIYTDGSHFKTGKNGRLGIGGVLVGENGKKIKEFSVEITRDYLEQNYGTSDCSNPTMEILAVLIALKEFKDLGKYDNITFKMDYIGVPSWLTGKWKINKPYIKKIKDEISKELITLGLNKKVDFVWIRGHQSIMDTDTYWNDRVDKLAKGL